MSSIPSSNLHNALTFLQHKLPQPISTGVVLGSGWGGWADGLLESVPNTIVIPYEEIPGFPQKPSGIDHVQGHKGRLLLVPQADNTYWMLCQGRLHYYQGYAIQDVPFPIRLMAGLMDDKASQTVILTNAAGGIDHNHRVGDVMVITDHLNMTGTSPLMGLPEGLSGFVDMTIPYAPILSAMALEVATEQGLNVHTGVYAGVSGPCYETPAEVRMFQAFGADAVGMSTVSETIVARQLGLRVLGLSCITNAAAGKNDAPLNHQEVLDVSKAREKSLSHLLDGILNRLPTC